ncbi:WAP four-disulfide core domain protein 2 [Dromiciops gliroides]|uniref:WAP four-disulfide core domain protein 2 n=1 Tax=Dromiciops gliroides TaxID=33562 RepID=UPI001CC73F8F|nr:WAP four-disulfide core domain protein 2 [Dromiciops gliroides]XP_043844734.1 WAP four-disulfide core domain protein 2 [Dromiciops gliroides]
MARKPVPFSAFFGGLFLLFLVGLAAAIGQNDSRAEKHGGAEKHGVCPEIQNNHDCPNECSSDGDCPDTLKCCTAGCTSVCIIPNEKKGKCPQISDSISQLAICRDECWSDTDCPGQLKCCINGCGNHSCSTPED